MRRKLRQDALGLRPFFMLGISQELCLRRGARVSHLLCIDSSWRLCE